MADDKRPVKTFVVDTNVLMEYPECIFKLANGDNEVVIHPVVINELEGLCAGLETKNYDARIAFGILNKLNIQSKKIFTTIDGGVIRLDGQSGWDHEFKEYWPLSKNDNKIIALAIALKNGGGSLVKLVTLDEKMAFKARYLGIEVEDLKDIRINIDKLYRGYRHIVLPIALIETIKSRRFFIVDDLPEDLRKEKFFENEFVILNSNYKLLFRYNGSGFNFVCNHPKEIFGIKPRENNLSQMFAWNLLFDKKVEIASLFGNAGSGKTLLAFTAALAQLKNFPGNQYEKLYDRIVIITPTVALSKEQDLGYLPGEKIEKILPWVQAVFDNFKIIEKSSDVTHKLVASLIEDGVIEFMDINHVRGRSLSNSCIIAEEAQNFTYSEIKLIGTRPAEGSKIIFTGDPSQVNRAYLRKDNNGLVRVVEAFKDCSEAGAVYFDQVVRSRIAELFAEKF